MSRPETSVGAARGALLALGVLVGAYGAWLLLSRQDLDQLVNAAIWLVGGIVLHDFVLAPLVLLLAFVGLWLLPTAARAPAAAGLLVLGTVTVAVIPVLTGLGRRADNPTLLPRSYGVAWLVLAAVVVLVVVVASLLRARGGASAGRAEPAGRAAEPRATPEP